MWHVYDMHAAIIMVVPIKFDYDCPWPRVHACSLNSAHEFVLVPYFMWSTEADGYTQNTCVAIIMVVTVILRLRLLCRRGPNANSVTVMLGYGHYVQGIPLQTQLQWNNRPWLLCRRCAKANSRIRTKLYLSQLKLQVINVLWNLFTNTSLCLIFATGLFTDTTLCFTFCDRFEFGFVPEHEKNILLQPLGTLRSKNGIKVKITPRELKA